MVGTFQEREMDEIIKDKPVILIIDDDEDTLKLYSIWLTSLGTIRTAKDGADAWVSVKSVKPNILIVDLLMPIIDGYQFLKMVNADETLIDIPVILNTGAFAGLGSDKDSQALQKVVDIFLFKPVARKKMIESVKKILDSVKGNSHDGND
jgi:twitching motility two-component system response regulator PilH